MKKIAILQSNYIPWKGYFDIINSVDEFVIYDEAQYTRRDWRNRNIIKTKGGLLWLTIPVIVKDRYTQKISEVKIADKYWSKKHWETIKHSYRNAPFFDSYKEVIEKVFVQSESLEKLSDVNRLFIDIINSILGIKTHISQSTDFMICGNKSQKIISICKQANANVYLSGFSAKCYIDEKVFSNEGISVEWAEYIGYPEYNQMNPPFTHCVSILDLIFCQGKKATTYMKSFQ